MSDFSYHYMSWVKNSELETENMKYAVELRTTIKVNQGRNINACVATEMDKKDDVQIGTMRAMIEL